MVSCFSSMQACKCHKVTGPEAGVSFMHVVADCTVQGNEMIMTNVLQDLGGF